MKLLLLIILIGCSNPVEVIACPEIEHTHKHSHYETSLTEPLEVLKLCLGKASGSSRDARACYILYKQLKGK